MLKQLYKPYEKPIQAVTGETLSADAMIDKMAGYLKNAKKRSASDGTIKCKTDFVMSTLNKMNDTPLDFSPEWLTEARRRLEATVSRNSLIWYLYALQDFYAANGHPITVAKPELIEKSDVVWHTPEQVNRIIRESNGIRDKAIISLLYYAALRNKECRYLVVADVDLKNGFVQVKDNGGGLKTYRERKIPLSPKAIPALQAWMDARASYNIETPWLFVNHLGQQFTRCGFSELVQRTARRAGIESHPHALRHSRATHLANDHDHPVPVPQLQKFLGHRLISTTQKYLHSQFNDVRSSVLRCDA